MNLHLFWFLHKFWLMILGRRRRRRCTFTSLTEQRPGSGSWRLFWFVVTKRASELRQPCMSPITKYFTIFWQSLFFKADQLSNWQSSWGFFNLWSTIFTKVIVWFPVLFCMQYRVENLKTLNALDHLDFLFCVSRKKKLHYFFRWDGCFVMQ